MKHSVAFGAFPRVWISISILVLSVSASIPASAQAVYGNVWGTVTSSGQPIGGATITVVSEEKGSKERVTSNLSGIFTVSHLLPDTYNIRVEASGYETREFIGQEIYADHTVNLSFQLVKGLGAINAQSADAGSLLKTDRADVSTTLSLQELQDLPNFTRNFTAFEILAPGALPNAIVPSVLRPNQNPQQGTQINQNGQHFSGSAFQLDGTDDRDPIAGIIVINPSLESLSEMKITTQNFDAEFGQALAGLVTAQTRSGSNQLHGSAFEIRDSNWAAASNPNLNNPNVANNPFKVNEFSGSFGGPLVKNRLFIFGDYQGHRRSFDVTRFVPVPTKKVHDTCLNPASTVCDLSDYPVAIYQPGTSIRFGALGTICKTNCIPTPMLSPPAVNLLNLLPPPNAPEGRVVDNKVTAESGYKATEAEPWNDDEFDLRVDQNVSERFKLFGRYSFADFRINADGVFGPLGAFQK